MNKLIIISGPTASGKTKTSIAIANMIKSHGKEEVAIVNFDSLLFYKEISIGTAKPYVREREGIDHYLIDIESIKSPMNAAQFIEIGKKKIDELFLKKSIVILVGGSAFYLRALLKGMYDSIKPDDAIKLRLESQYEAFGITPFIEHLKINDPEALKTLHPNDHYRLIRAVEHFEASGSKISEQKKLLDGLDPYDFSQIIHPWTVLHLYLDLPKPQHFEIIQARTKTMLEQGLIEEIKSLKEAGYTLQEKPLGSIGYKEAIDFINGNYTSLKDCEERISISTRQLAKSQRTFFNKISPKESFNPLLDQVKILERVALFLGFSNE